MDEISSATLLPAGSFLLDGLAQAEWSEVVKGAARLRSKMVVPNQVDMFPPKRCDMGNG